MSLVVRTIVKCPSDLPQYQSVVTWWVFTLGSGFYPEPVPHPATILIASIQIRVIIIQHLAGYQQNLGFCNLLFIQAPMTAIAEWGPRRK